MTILRAAPDHRLDLTRQALRHTSEAWELAMRAAMDHDPREARHVMRGAQARRTMLRTAHQHLLWSDASGGHRTPRRATPLDVVADLVRINRLLGELSQTVLAVPDAEPPAERERADIDCARRIGSTRLRYFSESMPRPAIDRDYVASGHDLLDALADLAETTPRRGTTSDVCLALMIALVETSRHATRIA